MKNIIFEPKAQKQLDDWERTSPSYVRKISRLILEISQTPFSGTGKPEALKHKLSGLWSRRIDREHRLVYRVTEDAVIIVSCRYHYE